MTRSEGEKRPAQYGDDEEEGAADPSSALLDDGEPAELAPAGEILGSFALMSVSFSINHGAVTGSVALASSVLGSSLGGSGAGTLYLMYTLSALLVAKPLVRRLGEKKALLAGLLLYSVYLASFLGAFLCSGADHQDGDGQPLCSWIIFNGGSAIGGFAAGFYWTAQGAYYSGAADLWAKAKGVSPEEGNARLAGIFATIFLTLELTVKAGSYGALKGFGDHTGRLVVFGSYATVAVLAAFGMAGVRTLTALGAAPPVPASPLTAAPSRRCAEVAASGRLLCGDPRMAMLLPVNVAFGFTQALINNVVYADIVKPYLGAAAVALLSGAICGVAAIISMPLSHIANTVGKHSIVWVGMAMFGAQGCMYLLFSSEDLGHWGIMCGLLTAQAAGRAAWEGANKALTADYFPADRSAAFSNVVMQSGGSAAIGFYLFPKLSHRWVASICVGAAGCSLLSVPVAEALHRRRQRASELCKDDVSTEPPQDQQQQQRRDKTIPSVGGRRPSTRHLLNDHASDPRATPVSGVEDAVPHYLHAVPIRRGSTASTAGGWPITGGSLAAGVLPPASLPDRGEIRVAE
eukprot:TRINITY_DN8137_c0_g1_i1.p1 TRINITY_DN8137_c0_g1~~TRINITY_DN8137_c0_g1_i1.p1  ORF type:complete len:576 (+),score=129.23 TRINITY_DN8137_c0_g1_i1:97-1824(+)